MTATTVHENDKIEGNCHLVRAGATITADTIVGGWQRTIKICKAGDAASVKPAEINLPPVRQWNPRDLLIVDADHCGFVVFLHGDDEMYNGGAFKGTPAVVRLTPVIDGRSAGWAALS